MTTETSYTTSAGTGAIAHAATVLRQVLDATVEAPAWSMSAEEQRASLVQLSQAQAQLAELRLRVLAAGDVNDIGKENASSSTAAWLAGATRQERAKAHGDLKLARALDGSFAATRTALAQARVNEAQARVIVAAVTALPETVSTLDRGRAEAHLVELAGEYDAKELKALGRKIFEVIDPEAADRLEGERLAREEREAARKTTLRMHDNGDGTVTGRFKIPTLHAQMLSKALNAFTSPRRLGKAAWTQPDGTRVPRPEMLGRGLCELIERYPVKRLPKAGGVNATVVVTMTLEQLLGGLGAAGLDTGAVTSAGQARRLACEAGIIPAVLGGKSVVLDLGRKRRFHTEAQRVAMALRDQGCVTEHCDRPAGWCEAHHPTPWSQGGDTSLENGALLCPWHHHRAHDTHYDMTRLPNGQVRFRRRQ